MCLVQRHDRHSSPPTKPHRLWVNEPRRQYLYRPPKDPPDLQSYGPPIDNIPRIDISDRGDNSAKNGRLPSPPSEP
nr:hypothetical protein CFP56_78593 [Quercus suber]